MKQKQNQVIEFPKEPKRYGMVLVTCLVPTNRTFNFCQITAKHTASLHRRRPMIMKLFQMKYVLVSLGSGCAQCGSHARMACMKFTKNQI